MSTVLPPDETPSDNDLIARAQGGDRGAFELLYTRHAARLTVLLAARFRGQVEDVLQDAFLRAWCNIHRYDRGNFAAWVFTLAQHSGIDAIRRRRPQAMADLDDHATGPEQEPPAILAGIEEQKALQQRQETLQRCLEKLEKRSRELIENQYGGEEDHAALCARLGIAARYGYKLRCVAMKQLRRCVKRGSP